MWFLPEMLTRAGFWVDVIGSSRCLRHSRFVRRFDFVPSGVSLIPVVVERIREKYDWIIPTEDDTLRELLQSELSLEDKLRVLPVQREEHFSHLFSKVGLAKIFAAHGIQTPPSRVAHNQEEALAAAEELGFPVLLKQDASNGGLGIDEWTYPSWVRAGQGPFLVQKKLDGVELDLSGIFFEGKLVHFAHSKIERVWGGKYGPSSLRTYTPLSLVPREIFEELSQIGRALGLHGFTTISCMQVGQERFYFEVDVRPNVWVSYSLFLGDDPAPRIRNWFAQRETLHHPASSSSSQQRVFPYLFRLKHWEVLCNRYRSWHFLPKGDPGVLLWLLISFFFTTPLKQFCLRVAPPKYHAPLRRLYKKLFFW